MQAGTWRPRRSREAGDVGSAILVDDNAAAHVVGGRDHGDGLLAHVDADRHAGRWIAGKRSTRNSQVGHVEEHAVDAAALELGVDGAGNHVARRQLLPRVVACHEGLPAAAQDAALAAERLADEERLGVRMVQAGRVKLDELEVGDRAPAR